MLLVHWLAGWVQVEEKNPVVMARIGRDPSKPTVTFYGAALLALLRPSCTALPWLCPAVVPRSA